MRVDGTFEVVAFTPASVDAPDVETGLGVGVATMAKQFSGGVVGRAVTLFTSAFDQATGVGTYLAMESFDGSLGGRAGTFNFAHAATTLGEGREDEYFTIVPTSGTGELAGITGTGGLAVDGDGTHRVWFEFDL